MHPKTVVRLCCTVSQTVGWHETIKFVSSFRYLGHIVQNNECDDDDIAREIRNLFVHTNILKRLFHKCTPAVKLTLFKCYCMCFFTISVYGSS